MPERRPPDYVVFATLILESVVLGHDDPDAGIAWAVDEGYIEVLPDEPKDSNIRILDRGRDHVAAIVRT